MSTKYFLFKHGEKFILGISVCYLLYTIICAFITARLKIPDIDSKLLSLSTVIDRKLKTEVSPSISADRKDAAELAFRLTTPPPASLLLRAHLFGNLTSGGSDMRITTKDLLKKSEAQPSSDSEGVSQETTEFILKGGTADMALIQVRKFYKDQWWAESFTVGKGEIIGEGKKIGAEIVDFHTYCRLTEITPLAPKPFFTKKATVLRDEKDHFLGISMTEEKHTVAASQIAFENEKGQSYHVWIGELVKLGTETVTVCPVANTRSTH
ncbi:MAG: hypothetical protein DCC43_10215 [Candidatus Brocadia sp.]|uniref:Uncharacterized protein n=1 Tax=Candidatus Brocadia fulgida TaxID=380242 RepID=A0A0M2V2Y2_9BACT|nr:MAG: hypothetical protein BROFUL_00229 [Candidatus Brocadia fulgida]MCC6325542.1 hypothetical protein [Candidatus Brocadia sp.]MCE7912398.1 hypothetical protein [Candidatus Brocadia sp. AMX3]MBV6519424.1 hypothetical protein [Candidatus Brocadia fulgida]MDG5995499.1 hypothetical protein [Candidatus Brocadia sp.]